MNNYSKFKMSYIGSCLLGFSLTAFGMEIFDSKIYGWISGICLALAIILIKFEIIKRK